MDTREHRMSAAEYRAVLDQAESVNRNRRATGSVIDAAFWIIATAVVYLIVIGLAGWGVVCLIVATGVFHEILGVGFLILAAAVYLPVKLDSCTRRIVEAVEDARR